MNILFIYTSVHVYIYIYMSTTPDEVNLSFLNRRISKGVAHSPRSPTAFTSACI